MNAASARERLAALQAGPQKDPFLEQARLDSLLQEVLIAETVNPAVRAYLAEAPGGVRRALGLLNASIVANDPALKAEWIRHLEQASSSPGTQGHEFLAMVLKTKRVEDMLILAPEVILRLAALWKWDPESTSERTPDLIGALVKAKGSDSKLMASLAEQLEKILTEGNLKAPNKSESFLVPSPAKYMGKSIQFVGLSKAGNAYLHQHPALYEKFGRWLGENTELTLIFDPGFPVPPEMEAAIARNLPERLSARGRGFFMSSWLRDVLAHRPEAFPKVLRYLTPAGEPANLSPKDHDYLRRQLLEVVEKQLQAHWELKQVLLDSQDAPEELKARYRPRGLPEPIGVATPGSN